PHAARSIMRRLSIPARWSGPLNATIDAFEITVLSRSKNAATRPSTEGTGRGYRRVARPPATARWGLVPPGPLSYRRPHALGLHPGPAGELPPMVSCRHVAARRREVPVLVACWSSKGGSGT